MTRKVSNESDALGQYCKTIQIPMLARVNGYYSPYSPQTIMEEEANARYGDVFLLAEKEFLKHRLLTLYPKITDEGIEISITFLEKLKLYYQTLPMLITPTGWHLVPALHTPGFGKSRQAACPVG